MVDYGWPRVENEKMTHKSTKKKKMDFYIDPGGPGGHPGGSRSDPGAEKDPNNEKNPIFLFILSLGGHKKHKILIQIL